MDQLQALRAFIRIAEAGSFAKAADSLRLPRSTVSKLIQDLEGHLGTKLIQRTTRTTSVTPEGAAYYERGVRLLSEVDAMDAAAGRAQAQPKGQLRVDVGSVLANLVLIPALPAFHARFPEVELQLGVSDRPADLIGDGVDCVIRGGVLSDTSLIARRIAELDYVTCASPAYLKTHGRPKHPRDLEHGHDVLSYFSSQSGKPFALYFERGGETHEIAGRAPVSVNESTAHHTGLLCGLGISQTFRFVVQPDIERGALVAVLSDWTRPRHPLHVVYPPNRHLSAKLRVFVDWVAEIFAPFDDRR